jgi:hydroxylamine reductase
MSMFCYQCEQTARGTGCNTFGVCGKSPDVACLQDLLVYMCKGISMYAYRSRKLGSLDKEIGHFVAEALFTTITNVNFDPERIKDVILKAKKMRDKAKAAYLAICEKTGQKIEELSGPATFEISDNLEELEKTCIPCGIQPRIEKSGPDITGLQELLTYGLKGTAAYVDHAFILGEEDDDIYSFFFQALDYLTKENPEQDKLIELNLKCGEINYKAMGMLDKANTGAYGHPVPTPVRITAVKGKAILVSGHDLKDLEDVLKQTEGKGINIYTHGEMLPCHGYPDLKKYKHLVGNYGGAWQDQKKEFDAFPGPILMTTNCIQKPKESYIKRIFTCGLVAWPDVIHISDRNFSPVIEAALAEKGFEEDEAEKTILVGFGHNAVLGVADKIVEAVKAGKIRHFFLVGGCDGAKPGRNYFTDFAKAVPDDCVILTLACGKYRFNKLDFGDIGGIPRLLDIGQCNDAYSAIQIAVALSDAFETDVNSLPLSIILSWYEQKAVCILLTLLFLGIKDIKLGPSLPAFITPPVLQFLVDTFNIAPISTPEEDLKSILG